ncbi:hypothetical protein F5Y04DRAFT_140382 [Hypomontagnella monticulosa]|nr:hypothetical protein F5Y04DRAFT_140382 [Hypomontagnella monticulosa]
MDAPKTRRSRTGCVTCRGRKVRCDEQHPACRACTRLRLTCKYVLPGESDGLTRKNSRPRLPKFRVRFVDADGSKRQGQTPETDPGEDGPPSPTSTSPKDALTMSPMVNGSGTFSQTITHRGGNPNALGTLASSSLWSDKGTPQTLEDYQTSLSLSYSQDGSVTDNMAMSEDLENMLDSINFPADIGLLWDSIPPFEDVGPGFTNTNEATYDENPGPSNMLQSPVSSREPDIRETVIIQPEDQEPLQHYLSTMVKFAKIRSSASDNIYCYIFTNMGLTHQPLYEAILAWAASHLAHVKSSPTSDAEARYARAAGLLYNDVRAREHVDLTLVTVWILLQYELFSARGVDGFVRLLDYAGDIVEDVFEHNHADVVKERLGPVGLRVLMWLSAYDSRAAPFGNPCRLLRCLKAHSSIYNVTDSRGKGSAGHAIEFGTVESKVCLRLALRLNILRGSSILLGRRQDNDTELESSWDTLRSNLQAIRKEVEESSFPASKLAMRVVHKDMDVPTTINTLEYNWLQLLGMYYSSLIYFQQYYPQLRDCQDEPSWPSREECSARIIRLSRHVSLSHPNSPQAIWPQTLFQAGVYTDDPIYQSWVLTTFAQAEAWGPNLRKIRHLLERISKYPREVKAHIDIIAVMRDLGGLFVV